MKKLHITPRTATNETEAAAEEAEGTGETDATKTRERTENSKESSSYKERTGDKDWGERYKGLVNEQ